MKGNKLIQNGEILLFGTIVKDRWIWEEDEGLISSVMFIQALSQFPGPVTVRVNCDGGDPEEGEAIRAAIEAHPAKVTVKVQGAAHSAASLMIMSAEEIEMSAGSLMLIHDPSVGLYGNPAELQSGLDDLETMAETYASVYAARAGKTVEEARAIMKAGITYSATQAVEEGFADLIAGDVGAGDELLPAEMQRQAQVAMMQAAGRVRAAQMKFEASQSGGSNSNSTEGAATGAVVPSINGETKMGKTATNAGAPATGAAQDPAANSQTVVVGASGQPAPDMQATPPAAAPDGGVAGMSSGNAAIAAAVAAERARGQEIRDMAAPFSMHLADGVIDGLISDGKTVDEARVVVMNAAAAAQPQAHRAIEINRDEGETRMEGMIGALMHQANPGGVALEGPAELFRGLRLKNLAMHLAGSGHGFDEFAAIQRGMTSTAMMGGAHGVSDFAYITGEVLNRSLKAAYKQRPQTWRKLSHRRTATDFRALHSVNFGGDMEFKKADENGEFESAVLEDAATSLKVERYGRNVTLTFEAVINDDMKVFERLPREFARRAATLESKVMWSLIRSNEKVDGTALFHASHKNLGGTGDITVANVAAARKAMWEQRPLGSKDKDDFIEVEPDLLFVPPALEVAAGKFIADTMPTKVDDANPFKHSLEPVTEARLGAAAGGSDTYWYLFSSDLPPLEHAYLDGYEAPSVIIKEGNDPDGVKMTARHIFGGALSEFRGSYRHG